MKSRLRILWLLAGAGALLVGRAHAAWSQAHDTTGLRLSPVVRRAVDTYNAGATARITGAFDVPPSKVVTGDVAVLNGPVTIAGRLEGTLVAINADVRFAPGGSVDQQVVVVGGGIAGLDAAHVGGEVLRQPELLRYHFDGELLAPDREPVYDDSWWRRHNVGHDLRHGEAYTDFFFVASRAYDRVEGLSFVVGPRFQRAPAWGKVNIETFAVVRTASPMAWGDQTLGHDVKAEVQFGKPIGVAAGVRAFDVVEPTEAWQMGDGEVGLAAVTLRRDFRDYYGRHGGEGYLRFQAGDPLDLTVSLADEQWRDERDRDPWTLFRATEAWRPNPQMDIGSVHVLTTRLRADTRDRAGSAWAGWYLLAEIERGAGRLIRLGAPVLTLAQLAPAPVEYTRGFFDLRRYNRLAPDVNLNVRLVTGGWLGGDALPTERRLSVGGPGTLPGFAFREPGLVNDVFQCSGGVVQPGLPAQCDRVALLQVELRSRFLAGSLRDDVEDDWWRPGFNHRMQWVLFADAGRGWRVGAPDGTLTYAQGDVPALRTWKTDVGVGLDFGGLGVYAAKAVSDASEPLRFTVRLEHRF